MTRTIGLLGLSALWLGPSCAIERACHARSDAARSIMQHQDLMRAVSHAVQWEPGHVYDTEGLDMTEAES